MKITIDRTHCNLCQSYCDRHVAKLIRSPLGEDRPCIQALEDDGQLELTLVIQDGANQATLMLTEQDREVLGLEGLSPFLPWTAGAAAYSLSQMRRSGAGYQTIVNRQMA
jgi:hypothetical protein